MSKLPPIFSVVLRSVVGELGEATDIDVGPECPSCGLTPPPVYRHVDYAFDRWNGEDLVTAMSVICVSERLKARLEGAALEGITFGPATTSTNDGFHLGPDAYASAVPRFYVLHADGTADGPQTWATWQTCPICGNAEVAPTKLGFRALAAAATDSELPLREVYTDSWNGEDVFNLPDHYQPVVSERFRAVVDAVNPKDARYGPALGSSVPRPERDVAPITAADAAAQQQARAQRPAQARPRRRVLHEEWYAREGAPVRGMGTLIDRRDDGAQERIQGFEARDASIEQLDGRDFPSRDELGLPYRIQTSECGEVRHRAVRATPTVRRPDASGTPTRSGVEQPGAVYCIQQP